MYETVTITPEYLRIAEKAEVKQVQNLIPKLIEIGKGKDVPQKVKALLGIDPASVVEEAWVDIKEVGINSLSILNEAKIPSISKDAKYLILGSVVVLTSILTLLYKSRKKQFGNLYNFKDLLREVVNAIGKWLLNRGKEIYKKLLDIMITVFTIFILTLIYLHFTKDVNTDKLSPKLQILLNIIKQKLNIKSTDSKERKTQSVEEID